MLFVYILFVGVWIFVWVFLWWCDVYENSLHKWSDWFRINPSVFNLLVTNFNRLKTYYTFVV